MTRYLDCLLHIPKSNIVIDGSKPAVLLDGSLSVTNSGIGTSDNRHAASLSCKILMGCCSLLATSSQNLHGVAFSCSNTRYCFTRFTTSTINIVMIDCAIKGRMQALYVTTAHEAFVSYPNWNFTTRHTLPAYTFGILSCLDTAPFSIIKLQTQNLRYGAVSLITMRSNRGRGRDYSSEHATSLHCPALIAL